LFTIVIPTYNRAKLIQPTLDSVISQTFADWECIVVDDGSTDNTKEVIQTYCQRDQRFKYIYQDNAERSAARNNGIQHAKGEWICFLDSDDLYEPQHLSDLATYIQEHPTPQFLFYGSSTLHNGSLSKNTQEPYDASPDYFIRNSVIPARVCIHRTLLEKFKFDPDIVIVEDTVLWTYLHVNFPTQQLPITSAIYRWHDDNSVNIANNCFLPRWKGLKKLFNDPEIQREISKKDRKIAISNCFYGIAKHHAHTHNFGKTCWWILRSILLDPRSPQTKAKIYLLYAFNRKNNL